MSGMKRRDFIRTATAAAATPMVPGGLTKFLPASGSLVERALTAITGTGYISASYLRYKLGITEDASSQLLAELQANGMLGPTELGGIMRSAPFWNEHAKIVASVAKISAAVPPLNQAKKATDVGKAIMDAAHDDLSRNQNQTDSELSLQANPSNPESPKPIADA